jgi:eukaryotic-like serine/threonine-protein kinase
MSSRVETGCLKTRTVAAFVAGWLDEGAVGAVARHIECCARCAEQVEMAALSAGDTTVMGGPVQHAPPLGAGALLGRYEVWAWIGQGGMGHVYDGFDPELERKVALKVLRSRGTFGDDERSQKRLAREAKTMAQLSNPHVVAVHDVGMFAGRVFLVMELVEGRLRRLCDPWPRSRSPTSHQEDPRARPPSNVLVPCR